MWKVLISGANTKLTLKILELFQSLVNLYLLFCSFLGSYKFDTPVILKQWCFYSIQL